jgi:uncharacterized protein
MEAGMKFRDNAKLDSSQVDDQRGRSSSGGGGLGGLGGGGGRMGIPMGKGGGLGAIIMVVLALIFGGGKLLGGGSSDNGYTLPGVDSGATRAAAVDPAMADISTCKTGADANARQDCRILAVVNDVNDFWASELPRRGQEYTTAKTQLFSGGTQTGCGPASSDVGPFYCPVDQKAYLDLGFFSEFETKFGDQDTAFAEAYVIAHEYGHHIQNLLGISEQVQKSGDQQGPDSGSVRLELQADCFAGVWAANATRGPAPLIEALTDQDIADGLDAAARVGDDYIQKTFQGTVNEETWTHGSSAQRQKWFKAGFAQGEVTDCDTFNGGI